MGKMLVLVAILLAVVSRVELALATTNSPTSPTNKPTTLSPTTASPTTSKPTKTPTTGQPTITFAPSPFPTIPKVTSKNDTNTSSPSSSSSTTAAGLDSNTAMYVGAGTGGGVLGIGLIAFCFIRYRRRQKQFEMQQAYEYISRNVVQPKQEGSNLLLIPASGRSEFITGIKSKFSTKFFSYRHYYPANHPDIYATSPLSSSPVPNTTQKTTKKNAHKTLYKAPDIEQRYPLPSNTAAFKF